MRLLEELGKRKDELERVLESVVDRFGNTPEGSLRISRSGKYIRYYNKKSTGSRNGKYIGSKVTDHVRDLAQKEYESEVIKRIKKELYCLKLYDGILKKGTYEDVYDTLSCERKALVTPVYATDEEYIKSWLSREYRKMGFKEGDPCYITKNGIKVRSKSEALIVGELNSETVPLLYEVPLYLKGYGQVRPDFMVLNVRTRKEYIWEHFGMLDKPEYLEEALKKIEAYIANGYIPGINLILTFESSNHPLDLKTVETLIAKYLK